MYHNFVLLCFIFKCFEYVISIFNVRFFIMEILEVLLWESNEIESLLISAEGLDAVDYWDGLQWW